MTRRIRVVVGISILIISITLLIWGLLPARREIRTQPISPTELKLPTPESLLPLDQPSSVLESSCEPTRGL